MRSGSVCDPQHGIYLHCCSDYDWTKGEYIWFFGVNTSVSDDVSHAAVFFSCCQAKVARDHLLLKACPTRVSTSVSRASYSFDYRRCTRLASSVRVVSHISVSVSYRSSQAKAAKDLKVKECRTKAKACRTKAKECPTRVSRAGFHTTGANRSKTVSNDSTFRFIPTRQRR